MIILEAVELHLIIQRCVSFSSLAFMKNYVVCCKISLCGVFTLQPVTLTVLCAVLMYFIVIRDSTGISSASCATGDSNNFLPWNYGAI